MRDSRRCPKCSHHEIIYVPRIADREHGAPSALAIHVSYSVWLGEKGSAGQLQAFICRKCGYTELYTWRPDGLNLAEIPGAQLLVGTPQTPYR